MTFELIDEERAHHAVSRLCSGLNVPRQGYGAWKRRPASRRRVADERLKRRILQVRRDSDQTYGVPRIHPELRLGYGMAVGRKQVARARRDAALDAGVVAGVALRAHAGHDPGVAQRAAHGRPRRTGCRDRCGGRGQPWAAAASRPSRSRPFRVVAHRPADDLAAGQVHDGDQKQPALVLGTGGFRNRHVSLRALRPRRGAQRRLTSSASMSGSAWGAFCAGSTRASWS
jgi:HTH-like domain